jgi:hypothetical protein
MAILAPVDDSFSALCAGRVRMVLVRTSQDTSHEGAQLSKDQKKKNMHLERYRKG